MRISLPASGHRRTPWKNGGGMTIDIAAAYRPDAEPGSWTGMVWRFGRTTIAAPGPFSDLAGYDRILTVVAGRGLVLRSPDGAAPLDIREPFRPTAFTGERALESELEAGAVDVVNLMGDRGSVAIGVDVLEPSGTLEVLADDIVLYAPGDDSVTAAGGETLILAGGDAVQLRPDGKVWLEGRTGTSIVARITRRHTSSA